MKRLSPERWRQIEQLLDTVLELRPDQRAAFLDRCPEADGAQREEVRCLLDLEERAERFFERPAAESVASLLSSEASDGDCGPVRERIGPYRIVGEAGRGGMGTVYVAERDDPQLRQRVALKLVSGMATEPLVRRFLDERQILASLEHPGIARLLDGGITTDGRPWFAMEYVDGIPIDRYCEERGLGIEARLRLFVQVCDAVQYAHQNLVVHRDLKPTNILVTNQGGVKLLDFGIAKLLAPDAGADKASLTQTGLRPMTPEYASPEQIRGDAISTASDVYALGILLYKLLTGQHPYALSDRPPHERARVILEEVPPPPSAAAAAARRRLLRGDLDTITLTAIRKEPERRYATAEQLAADVERHLQGKPVIARADTLRYRTGKFIRRHRMGVVVAVNIAAIVVGYGITVTVHAGRLAREAATTEEVKDFLASLFTQANPGVSGGHEHTASDLVEQGARRVAVELADQPAIQAEMMTLLGSIYATMGRYEAAIEQLAPALVIRRRLHPGAHENVTHTGQLLAEALHYQGRYHESEELLHEVLEMRRRLSGNESLEVAAILNSLGDLLHTRGDFPGAEEHLRRAMSVQLAVGGAEGDEIIRLRRDLANVLRDRGAYVEAESLYRTSLEAYRSLLGRADPIVALTRNELARLLAEIGEHQDAEELLRENLRVYEQLYPRGHPMVGTTMRNLGVLRLRQGRPAEAAESLREALAIYRRTLPPESALIPRAQRHLAEAVLASGDAESAAAIAEEAVAQLQNIGLDAHPALATALRTLNHARSGHHHLADVTP